jgi:hypothetical protein
MIFLSKKLLRSEIFFIFTKIISEAPGEDRGVRGQQNHAHNTKRLFSEQLRLAPFCLILLKNRKYFIVFRWKQIEKNQFNKYWRNVQAFVSRGQEGTGYFDANAPWQ